MTAEQKESRNRRVRLAKRAFHWWNPPKKVAVLGLNPSLGKKKFVVLMDVEYRNPLVTLDIEKGFRCDLASTPRCLWWLPGLSPIDVNARASLVHDVLYVRQEVDREIADALFLSIMRADGVSWPVRNAMYWAVRLFGKRAWDANAAANDVEVKGA